jgi:hypothetical protein
MNEPQETRGGSSITIDSIQCSGRDLVVSGSFTPYTAVLNSKVTACDDGKVKAYVARRIKKTIGKPNKWTAWDYRDSDNEPFDAIGEAILNATADKASIDVEIVITAKGEELAVRAASESRRYSNISIDNYQPDNVSVRPTAWGGVDCEPSRPW